MPRFAYVKIELGDKYASRNDFIEILRRDGIRPACSIRKEGDTYILVFEEPFDESLLDGMKIYGTPGMATEDDFRGSSGRRR